MLSRNVNSSESYALSISSTREAIEEFEIPEDISRITESHPGLMNFFMSCTRVSIPPAST